jgi:hypothetical protein
LDEWKSFSAPLEEGEKLPLDDGGTFRWNIKFDAIPLRSFVASAIQFISYQSLDSHLTLRKRFVLGKFPAFEAATEE